MRAIPRQLLGDAAARLSPRARVVDVIPQPGAGFGDGERSRLADEAGATVVHDLERPARVGGRDDRLLGEERLEGHHAEVLVHGRVVDGEAARVEIGELGVADAAGERHAAVEPLLRGQLLEPGAVGAVTGDHDRAASSLRRGPRACRSTRFARSSRPTESTKSPYSSQR